MPTRKKRRKQDGGMVAKTLEYLATQPGFIAERRNSGSIKVGERLIKLGEAGTFDVTGYYTPPTGLPVPFEIEAKSSIGKPRPSQRKRGERLTAARVPHCYARSLADVVAFVARLRVLALARSAEARVS